MKKTIAKIALLGLAISMGSISLSASDAPKLNKWSGSPYVHGIQALQSPASVRFRGDITRVVHSYNEEFERKETIVTVENYRPTNFFNPDVDKKLVRVTRMNLLFLGSGAEAILETKKIKTIEVIGNLFAESSRETQNNTMRVNRYRVTKFDTDTSPYNTNWEMTNKFYEGEVSYHPKAKITVSGILSGGSQKTYSITNTWRQPTFRTFSANDNSLISEIPDNIFNVTLHTLYFNKLIKDTQFYKDIQKLDEYSEKLIKVVGTLQYIVPGYEDLYTSSKFLHIIPTSYTITEKKLN